MISQVTDIKLKIDAALIEDIDTKNMISLYQKAIMLENASQDVHFNWHYINESIIKKWGMKRLKRIKAKAWTNLKSKA